MPDGSLTIGQMTIQLKEEYRRLVVALESKNPFENMHIRIQEELERFKLQNGIGGDERQ